MIKTRFLRYAVLCALLLQALCAAAAPKEFSFGVISPPSMTSAGETALRAAIEESDGDDLVFVVVNGIKAADEPCTDTLYNERHALLHTIKSGLIVSFAASDWAECANQDGKSSAIGKLNRLRDVFFNEELSFGNNKLPIVHQSAIAKFRSYVENARWEVGGVMFATLNLPSNNNHYVLAAGRNSEFEDRLIANRDWLHRVFIYAQHKKRAAIVLFCDGNPLTEPAPTSVKRDGFLETRRYLNTLAAKFPGKILLIHNASDTDASASSNIAWHGNMGELSAGAGLLKLTVNASTSKIFRLATDAMQTANRRP